MLTTRQKIALARAVQAPLMVFRRLFGQGPIARVRRGGVLWDLDLREGVDFSIYLLGAFERSTLQAYRNLVPKGTTVLDIGANVGAHTLHLARTVGADGRVYAFEPTAWAFERLSQNVALNPDVALQVNLVQAMLVADESAVVPDAIPSSWPLKPGADVHPKLRGRSMSTDGAISVTVDGFLKSKNVQSVDFVKLDVDGFECGVLAGMRETLHSSKPIILMELSPYVLEEKGDSLEKLLGILGEANYRFYRLGSKTPLPSDADSLNAMIADGAGFNIIARADGY